MSATIVRDMLTLVALTKAHPCGIVASETLFWHWHGACAIESQTARSWLSASNREPLLFYEIVPGEVLDTDRICDYCGRHLDDPHGDRD